MAYPATEVPVLASDLSARESGSSSQGLGELPNRQMRITDVSDLQVPSTVKVRYIEHSYDYLQAEVSETMINAPQTGVNQVDLPLVVSGQQARSIALTRLVRSYTERMTANVDLPPRYFVIEENDVLLVPFQGQTFAVRITEVDRGVSWLINVTGVIQGVTTVVARAVDCNSQVQQFSQPYSSAAVIFYIAVLDVPGLTTSDSSNPGIYVASAVPAGTDFRGGSIFESPDGQTSWQDVGSVDNAGVLGYALTALPDGPLGFWDNGNTVQVQLFSGELDSTDDFSVLGGANRIYIGGELIAFGTATLNAPGIYTLSDLLRGLNCTEMSTASHAINEQCVAFNTSEVTFQQINLSDIGTTKFFEAVPAGGIVGDFPEYQVTFAGNSLRQYSPCLIGASKSGGDITFNWTRRTREADYPIFSQIPPPLLASTESYTVEIYYGASLLRTTTVSGTGSGGSFTWTSSMQSTDSYSSGEMGVRIYQMNDYSMLGYPGQAIFTF